MTVETKELRDQKAMERGFRALGVKEGGALMVHASLKSLGPPAGGAETVVTALLSTLGPEGTLLMPALSYATVDPSQPVFDIRRTPACVGWLPEYFRQRHGTIRSLHPTHSVCAVGPLAQELLAGAELDTTPCGPHSAFSRLRDVDGQVLFIGCGMDTNTSIHAIEEHVEPSYLWGETTDYRLVRDDGSDLHVSVRNHNPDSWPQHYHRVAEEMPVGSHRTGRVLKADCHLLEAPAMWETGLRMLRRDPQAFTGERT